MRPLAPTFVMPENTDTVAGRDNYIVLGGSGVFRGDRGEVTRDGTQSTASTGCLERIWGLDSDGGLDWTDQPETSAGYENRGSGP